MTAADWLKCEEEVDWLAHVVSDWFSNELVDWLKFITGGSLKEELGDFLLNELMKLWCVWVNLASSSKKLSPHGIGDWKLIGVVFLKEKALLWPELGELKFLSVAGVEVFDNNTDL